MGSVKHGSRGQFALDFPTVIQKQYIVLKKESGRIYYFNNFYLKSLENKCEPLGDSVIYSIKFHF